MWQPFEALYLHIPFCVKRCAYCDFDTSAIGCDDPAIDARMAELINAVRVAGKAGLLQRVRTVYIGGGTPSYAGPKRLRRLLKALDSSLDLQQVKEFTVEVNPDSATPEVLDVLRQGGVGRLSIGVQSLDDEVLQTLGRVHSGQQAMDVVRQATRIFPNVSVDVICGVMGQSSTMLFHTLYKLLETSITHVSVYPLTVEEGTPLWRRVNAGELPDVDEDAQADHMLLARRVLAESGMQRYEVASYARHGCASLHNSAYWTGKAYLGLGAGAASMLDARDYAEVLGSNVLSPWMHNALVDERLQSVVARQVSDAAAEAAVGAVAQEQLSGAASSGSTSEAAARAAYGATADEAPGERLRGRVRISTSTQTPALVEYLTPREAACEDAMLGMRLATGIPRARFELLLRQAPRLLKAANQVVNDGLATWQNNRLMPTDRGWLLGNQLYGAMWDCASE